MSVDTSTRSGTPPAGAAKTGTAHLVRRGVVASATTAALVGAMSGIASAAPGDTSSGDTEANVAVASAIVLSGLTPSFTLTGVPGATVTGPGVVTMNVSTNNLAGYAVTVESATPSMAAGTSTNTDSVPIGALSVRESGSPAFTPLSDTSPVTVHSQPTRSESVGTTINNDFQVVIPFVNNDTYSATLNYIVTTL